MSSPEPVEPESSALNTRSSLLARAALCAALVLSGCGVSDDDRPVEVSVIGNSAELAAPLTYSESEPARAILAATAQGLVTYNAAGDVVPGLAQRWIVMDDGSSYIFRLRRARWANGDRVEAGQVKRLLQARIRAAVRRDPYGSIASVSNILAMTGDVLEIRLKTPRPNFLMALADPEMAVAPSDGGSGPYRKESMGGSKGEMRLIPDAAITDSDEPGKPSDLRMVRAERASKAVARFAADGSDLVLGGTLADLPFVTLAEIDGSAVRLDPVQGLFGLALSDRNPMFDDSHVRDALSMAIEREALVGYFAISRWKIAEQLMPQQLNLPHPPTPPSWGETPIAERRNLAIGTIARWRAQHGDRPVELTIEMPKGPGMDLLFIALSAQYRRIGVGLKRVEKNGDLLMIDEVAPYDSASWYLGRVSCARGIHCNKDAEELLKSSISAATMTDRLLLLGQAEPLVVGHGGFIPLATPVRWSLAKNRLDGFAPSPRGFHPLRWLFK